MRLFLHICEEFSDEFAIEFNGSKSRLLLFGNSPDIASMDISFVLQGNSIPKVTSELHLGNFISTSQTIKNDKAIQKACSELI